MVKRRTEQRGLLFIFSYPGRYFQAIVSFAARHGAGQDPNSQTSISGSAASNLKTCCVFEAFVQAVKKHRIFLPPGTSPYLGPSVLHL